MNKREIKQIIINYGLPLYMIALTIFAIGWIVLYLYHTLGGI